jgi:hypothetical protein
MQRIIINIDSQKELLLLTNYVKDKGLDYKIVSESESIETYEDALEFFSKPITPKKKLSRKSIVELVRNANSEKNARKKI